MSPVNVCSSITCDYGDGEPSSSPWFLVNHLHHHGLCDLMMIFMMVLMATIITMVSRDSQSSDVTRFCQQQALWLDQGPGVNSTVTCHPSSNLNLDLNDRDGDGSYISCQQLVNSPFYILYPKALCQSDFDQSQFFPVVCCCFMICTMQCISPDTSFCI